MSEATPTPPSKFASLLEVAKTNKLVWAGAGVLAVVAIGAGLYFGGVFGFSGRDICTATLKQAKDFGVISPSAELASFSAKSAEGGKGRKSCSAKSGDDLFTLLADLKKEDQDKKPCKDLKKQNSCVALYSVARADGMTTYQVREIPPNETDEALAAQQPPQAAPGAPGADGQAGSPLEAETAVDNGPAGGPAPAPAQSAPQQP